MDKTKKPIYKKWWFITIVALFVVGIIFSPSEEEKQKAEEAKVAKAELKAQEQELKKSEKEAKDLEDEKKKNAEESEKLAKKEAKELEEEEAKLAKEIEKEEKKKTEEAEKLAKKEAKELAQEEKRALEEAEKSEAELKKESAKVKNDTKEVVPVTKKEEPEEVEIDREKEIESAVKTIVKDDMIVTEINRLLINKNMAKDDGSYIVLPHLIWESKNNANTTQRTLEEYSDHLAAKLADQSDVSEITVFWEVPHYLEGSNVAKYMYERKGNRMAKVDKWLAPVIQ